MVPVAVAFARKVVLDSPILTHNPESPYTQ
jgi:hypothetical protein